MKNSWVDFYSLHASKHPFLSGSNKADGRGSNKSCCSCTLPTHNKAATTITCSEPTSLRYSLVGRGLPGFGRTGCVIRQAIGSAGARRRGMLSSRWSIQVIDSRRLSSIGHGAVGRGGVGCGRSLIITQHIFIVDPVPAIRNDRECSCFPSDWTTDVRLRNIPSTTLVFRRSPSLCAVPTNIPLHIK